MTVTVTYAFTDACTACGACLLTCPEHAIVAGLPLRVRGDRCTACGECVEVCPADAVVELRVPVPGGRAVPARPLGVAGGQHLRQLWRGSSGGAAGAGGTG